MRAVATVGGHGGCEGRVVEVHSINCCLFIGFPFAHGPSHASCAFCPCHNFESSVLTRGTVMSIPQTQLCLHLCSRCSADT